MHVIALYSIAAIGILSFVLELWTGCAVVGLEGERSIIQRRKRPRQYWFVMILQSLIMAVTALMIFRVSSVSG